MERISQARQIRELLYHEAKVRRFPDFDVTLGSRSIQAIELCHALGKNPEAMLKMHAWVGNISTLAHLLGLEKQTLTALTARHIVRAMHHIGAGLPDIGPPIGPEALPLAMLLRYAEEGVYRATQRLVDEVAEIEHRCRIDEAVTHGLLRRAEQNARLSLPWGSGPSSALWAFEEKVGNNATMVVVDTVYGLAVQGREHSLREVVTARHLSDKPYITGFEAEPLDTMRRSQAATSFRQISDHAQRTYDYRLMHSRNDQIRAEDHVSKAMDTLSRRLVEDALHFWRAK
jgi:hypothetical protein